jgi:protein TonB
MGPPAPPVFGASKESVTSGSSTFSVPLGNTVATAPENRGELQEGTPEPASPPPPPPKPKPVTVRTKPRILQEVKVPYPAKARELGITGTVKVRVLVGANGSVRQTRVVSGPGFGLNEAAQRALTRFRFQPAMGSNDRPMAYWITYRYTFQIED